MTLYPTFLELLDHLFIDYWCNYLLLIFQSITKMIFSINFAWDSLISTRFFSCKTCSWGTYRILRQFAWRFLPFCILWGFRWSCWRPIYPSGPLINNNKWDLNYFQLVCYSNKIPFSPWEEGCEIVLIGFYDIKMLLKYQWEWTNAYDGKFMLLHLIP